MILLGEPLLQVVFFTLIAVQTLLPQIPQDSKNTTPPPVRLDFLGDPLPAHAVARLGSTRLKHPGEVISVIFTPDGKGLISGCYMTRARGQTDTDGVRIWDPQTGKLLRRLGGFLYGPDHLALSKDGKLLATPSGASVIGILELETGKTRFQIRWAGGSNVVRVAFSPDAKVLAVKGNGSGIQLWDAGTGEILKRFGADGGGNICYSPDGKTLATTGETAVHVWDPATGKEIWHYDVPNKWFANVLQFSHDGQLLVVDSGDLFLLEARTGKLVRRWRPHDSSIESVAFAPDDTVLATGCDGRHLGGKGGGEIRLWDLATGKLIRSIPSKGQITYALDFSPDGKILASGDYDELVRLYDPKTGEELLSRRGHQDHIQNVAYSPDGKVIASSGFDGALKFWRWQSDQAIQSFHDSDQSLNSIQYSPDGKHLATGGEDGKVRLYDPVAGLKKSLDNQSNSKQIWAVAYHPSGKFLAASGLDYTRLWDVGAVKELRRFDGGGGEKQIVSIAFSPDGKMLAFGRVNSTIQIVEAETGKPIRHFGGDSNQLCAIAFRPGSKSLAAAYHYGITRLLDVNSGAEQVRYGSNGNGTQSIAFSPDGWFLAAVDNLTDVLIWEALTGKEVQRFKGHDHWVMSVAFAPDGKTVASGCRDRSVLVWDATGLDEKLGAATQAVTKQEIEKCWNDLTSSNALTACRAMWKLRSSPREAAECLGKQLAAAPPVNGVPIAKWIAELDDAQFTVREQATLALAKLGEAAMPALQDTAAIAKTAERRRRCEDLLGRIQEKPLTPETLRELRAIAALELMSAPEAEQVLGRLAAGGSGARITRESQGALQRRKQRMAAR